MVDVMYHMYTSIILLRYIYSGSKISSIGVSMISRSSAHAVKIQKTVFRQRDTKVNPTKQRKFSYQFISLMTQHI